MCQHNHLQQVIKSDINLEDFAASLDVLDSSVFERENKDYNHCMIC